MKKFLPAYLLLLVNAAPASAKPIYRQAPPASFCTPASDLGQEVQSCEANGTFVKHASECWDKLDNLHKRVTKELDGVIGNAAVNAQAQSMLTSQATYEEGSAAHEYMFYVTKKAKEELDEYFDYVVYPEDAESDEEILAGQCYSSTADALDAIADKVQEKLVDIVSQIETEDLLQEESAARAGMQGSAGNSSLSNPSASQSKGKSAPAVKKENSKNSSSTITGVEEDKKKQGK